MGGDLLLGYCTLQHQMAETFGIEHRTLGQFMGRYEPNYNGIKTNASLIDFLSAYQILHLNLLF